jgi:hypothetical protein
MRGILDFIPGARNQEEITTVKSDLPNSGARRFRDDYRGTLKSEARRFMSEFLLSRTSLGVGCIATSVP